MVLKATTEKLSSRQSLLKANLKKAVQKYTAKLWTVISNQVIKYQLPYTQFDQISDHKYDKHFYGKLSTKLLAQAAYKVHAYEDWTVTLFLSMLPEVTVRKIF